MTADAPSHERARRTIDPVRALVDTGGRFMTSPHMDAAAEPFGMKSGVFYFRGRVAALGDVPSVVAAAALGIFPQALIELVWERSGAMPAHVALTGYHDACAMWGREYLARLDRADRLCQLGARVIDAVEPSGLLLFSAWQSQPRPDDAAGCAAFVLMQLRELRGGLHFAALRANGLDIPTAVLADPNGGLERMQRTGWRPEQIEDVQRRAALVEDLTDRWAAAEAMTDATYAAATDVLSIEEHEEMIDLILAAEAISR